MTRKDSLLHQPRAVWAVAFACATAFMGIGLVDPILQPIAESMHATPSQVSLLFTSYMAVMGAAMLVTSWVSSRIGAKRTLLTGLTLIMLASGLAAASDSITAIVALRAVWGLGNALFIATAFSTLVTSARGPVGQAVILFEAALGIGFATGPLIGGQLGAVSWRLPFLGVAVLMAGSIVATFLFLPGTPPSGRRTALSEPLRALRHPGLLTVALTALLYGVGFFLLLAITPFPLGMGAVQIGWVFFGWGLLLAVSSVWVAPALQRRLGALRVVVGSLTAFGTILAVMALAVDSRPALVACVVLAGGTLGLVNTVLSELVMGAAPVESPVAAAAYSFVRFAGGAVAPWLGGKLYEHVAPGAPFWLGAGAVLLGVAVLLVGRRHLHREEELDVLAEAEAVEVGAVA